MISQVTILLLIAVFGYQALEDSYVDQQWIKFEKDFDKSYRSPVEKRNRYRIFKENLNRIESNNALFEEGKSDHKEGINKFTDWSSEEFLTYVNRGLRYGSKTWSGKFKKKTDFVLPKSVDWRNKSAVTGVKNQGGCPSSWPYSVVGAIEGQLGVMGSLITLSEQNLIDCVVDHGCNGGSTDQAYDYVRRNGIESEVEYPEIWAEGTCHADPSKIITRISNFFKIPSEDEVALQQALARAGPIAVVVVVTDNLMRYGSGIFSDGNCRNKTQNHAVLVVGYGSENGRDFYTIKNSWGDKWGENGYFRLARNKANMCGVASSATYPVI